MLRPALLLMQQPSEAAVSPNESLEGGASGSRLREHLAPGMRPAGREGGGGDMVMVMGGLDHII